MKASALPLLLPLALLPACEDGATVILLPEATQQWDATLAGWALDSWDAPAAWVESDAALYLEDAGSSSGLDWFQADLNGSVQIPLFDPWTNRQEAVLLLDLDGLDGEMGAYDPWSADGPWGSWRVQSEQLFWDASLGWIRVEQEVCLAPLDGFLEDASQGELLWNARVYVEDAFGVFQLWGEVAGVGSPALRLD